MDCTTVRLVDGGYMKIKVVPEMSVQDILLKVLKKVSPESVQKEQCSIYTFYLIGNNIKTFLCPHRLWSEVVRSLNLDGSFSYVLELTLQVFPSVYSSLHPENPSTFNYLMKQIKRTYFSELANCDNKEKATILGCLELRTHMKGRDSSKSALDVIEKHGGFSAFFPPCVLSNYKGRHLKKYLHEELRKLASLSAEAADFKFIEILKEISDFESTKMPCSLGAGLATVEASLVISPKNAVSLRIEHSSQLKRVGDFCDIIDIQLDGKTKCVRIIFTGKENDPLSLTFASIDDAEFAAHLIDAYRNDGGTVSEDNTVLRNGCFYCVLYNDESVYDGEDYADFQYGSSSEELPFRELPRHQIVLERMLGEGQFGDVYRGAMREGGQEDVAVAVKTCKDTQDETATQKFLQEAVTMSQFDHPHIIRLIGVIKEKPIWIVMELAFLGELRPYLIQHAETLDSSTLLMFCYQISSALSYLEMRNIVHRDIAARNILVSSKVCVKLADFGLTRWLDTNTAYTSSQGKLPLKWMAPESIHYRRFSSASDVWMFAVCMWEILQVGVKPFHGVKNNDAILMIENGKRLEKPTRCPQSTYNLMLSCWSYDKSKRPTFAQIKSRLFDMMNEQRRYQPPSSPEARASPPSVPGRSGALPPPPKPVNPADGVRVEDIINQSLPSLHILGSPSAPPPPRASVKIAKDESKHSKSLSNPTLAIGVGAPSRAPPSALPPVPSSPQTLIDNEDVHPLANTSLAPAPEPSESTSPVMRRPPERSKSFDNKRVLNEALNASSDCRRSYSLEQVNVSPEVEDATTLDNNHLTRPINSTSLGAAKLDVSETSTAHQKPLITLEGLYASVVNVVKSVHSLNARVSAVSAAECARLVGEIGQRLKILDTTAELLIESSNLSEERKDSICLARSVLTSDFADLFKAFKLAQGAENIPRLYRDYCIEVLQKAHALAIDSRQVYEAATKPRSGSLSMAPDPK